MSADTGPQNAAKVGIKFQSANVYHADFSAVFQQSVCTVEEAANFITSVGQKSRAFYVTLQPKTAS